VAYTPTPPASLPISVYAPLTQTHDSCVTSQAGLLDWPGRHPDKACKRMVHLQRTDSRSRASGGLCPGLTLLDGTIPGFLLTPTAVETADRPGLDPRDSGIAGALLSVPLVVLLNSVLIQSSYRGRDGTGWAGMPTDDT